MSENNVDVGERGHWGSKLGFIVASVGSAVGLGNIWKFPYIVGDSGGAAFIAVYLFCIGFVGFPILIAEWLIGRRGQLNPVASMVKVAKEDGASPYWAFAGALGVFSSFVVLSFYSVIGGWTLEYIFHGISGDFAQLTNENSTALYSGMLASPVSMLITHTMFMGLTIGIVAFGVGGGIEKASKFLMPALLLILIAMVIYGVMSPGFGQAVEFLFLPNWSKLTTSAVLAALGHAFFTLTLGMGVMISYGSYLGNDVNLVKTGALVVGLDTIIALGAGVAIFPVVFSYGLDATSGPGLLFKTLPIAFGNLPGGELLGIAFFVLLCFAALTSSISLLEPSVELVEEKFNINRKLSVLLVGASIWALGLLSVASMNIFSDVTIGGRTIFDFLDFITSMITMPIGGFFLVIFCGYVMKQQKVKEQFGFGETGMMSWKIVSRYVAPIAVAIVFLHGMEFLNPIYDLLGW